MQETVWPNLGEMVRIGSIHVIVYSLESGKAPLGQVGVNSSWRWRLAGVEIN